MAVTIDIFNPQVSVIARGLEGKTIMIYGDNNLGKTYVAARMSKPFFIAAESGLNAQSGVKYLRVQSWSDIKKIIKQFTSNSTFQKAREMYDTIVIDEVYASSIMCQDYVMSTYGDGAKTLADGDSKHNLYSLYEKEYFRMINLLLSRDYTVVFIGHQQEKDNYISPKGDKRCLGPIIDNCDFVVYVKGNGVDEKGELIKSDGHMVATKQYFARSRFTHCPPVVSPFTAENLEKAIVEAVEAEEKLNGATVVSYEEQKSQNTVAVMSYEELMEKIGKLGPIFIDNGHMDILSEIIEDVLGKGKKVADCTKRQVEALTVIYDNLVDKAAELQIIN